MLKSKRYIPLQTKLHLWCHFASLLITVKTLKNSHPSKLFDQATYTNCCWHDLQGSGSPPAAAKTGDAPEVGRKLENLLMDEDAPPPPPRPTANGQPTSPQSNMPVCEYRHFPLDFDSVVFGQILCSYSHSFWFNHLPICPLVNLSLLNWNTKWRCIYFRF